MATSTAQRPLSVTIENYQCALEEGVTYAALVREGGGFRQFAICGAEHARHMLTHSDAPHKLRFVRSY